MSWSWVRTHAHGETKATGQTVDGLILTSGDVGNILVVYAMSDNPDGTNGATTHHSITDAKGNIYTAFKSSNAVVAPPRMASASRFTSQK